MSDDLSKVDWGKPTPAEHAGGAYDPDCADCRSYAQANTPDPIAKRMEALVRRMAETPRHLEGPWSKEAREIVEALDPVDPDLIEARECVASVYEAANRSDLAKITRDGGQDNRLRVRSALIAFKRGRAFSALERDSREG